MASKDELQNALKKRYGINKNVSQALDREECERLLDVLDSESSVAKLAQSYAQKNSSLGSNNAYYSRMRNRAETKLETLKTEYHQLEVSIKTLEESKLTLEERKQQLEQEQRDLEAKIQALVSNKATLETKVENLSSANDQLKKENKALKNLIDAIKLKLAIDIKQLLKYEDSEIRKALIKLFKSTLG